MRHSLLNFLLLWGLSCFGQINPSEIHVANLIFAEHEKLSIENSLLKKQINSLDELNQLYIKTDSIQKEEISSYKDRVISSDKKIQHLESSRKKLILGSSVGGIILFILGLLL